MGGCKNRDHPQGPFVVLRKPDDHEILRDASDHDDDLRDITRLATFIGCVSTEPPLGATLSDDVEGAIITDSEGSKALTKSNGDVDEMKALAATELTSKPLEESKDEAEQKSSWEEDTTCIHGISSEVVAASVEPETEEVEGGYPTCDVCFVEVEPPTRQMCMECHHVVCLPCMRHYITSNIRNRFYPITCPGCGYYANGPIPDSVIRRLVSPADWKLYCIGSVLEALRDDREKICCPTPDCPNVFLADSKVRWVKCSICEKEWCRRCQSNDAEHKHSNPFCSWFNLAKRFKGGNMKLPKNSSAEKGKNEKLEVLLTGLMRKDRNYAKCPHCKVNTWKESGCNHMTCPFCHYHWCLNCRWSQNPSILQTMQESQIRLLTFISREDDQLELTPEFVLTVLTTSSVLFACAMIAYFVRQCIFWKKGSLLERQELMFQRG
ncbi:hypothetical protein HDU67_006889 [Dinochytrium kinnereticum]|nr:hypothetical protein HDU67_006889 [Dinochytrium kinnereticum]